MPDTLQPDKSQLVRIDVAKIAPPSVSTSSPYFRAALAPSQQLQPDMLGQFYRGNIPQTRHAPLPPSANAAQNAANSSTAIIVARQSIASPENIAINLDMPKEFLVSGSPSAATGTFDVTWAEELAGTVLASSISNPLGGGYVESATTNVAGGLVGGSTQLTSEDAETTAIFAFCCHSSYISGATQSGGFTQFGTLIPSDYGASHAQSSTAGTVYSTQETITQGSPSPCTIASGMAIFGGFVNQVTAGAPPSPKEQGGNFNNTIGWTPSTPVTEGNGLLLFLFGGSGNGNNYCDSTLTVTDGVNIWYPIFASADPGRAGQGPRVFCFYAPNVAAASTVSIGIFNQSVTTVAGYYYLTEITPATLVEVSGNVGFRALVGSDIPPIDLSSPGRGGVENILPVANGGSGTASPGLVAGANISITGTWPDETIAVTGLEYQTVEQAGAAKPQEPKLNFSSAFTVADNPSNGSTDIGLGATVSYAMEINAVGTALDKHIFINAVSDGSAPTWGVQINGASG